MEYIGWIGTFFGVVSFALLSFGLLKKEGKLFPLFSGIASLSFLISSFLINNYQAVISNSFFLLSSILALFGIIIKNRKDKREYVIHSLFIYIYNFFILLYYIYKRNLDISKSWMDTSYITTNDIFSIYSK